MFEREREGERCLFANRHTAYHHMVEREGRERVMLICEQANCMSSRLRERERCLFVNRHAAYHDMFERERERERERSVYL